MSTIKKHRVPRDLAKRLIEKLPLKPGDVIWDPFKADGAFFDQLPDKCHRDWSELCLGRNFKDYKKPVDWVVSCPPFHSLHQVENLHGSSFFAAIEMIVNLNLVKKGMAILGNKECYMSLTPKRMEWLEKKGYHLRKQIVCNLREYRGRWIMFLLMRDDARDLSDDDFKPIFDRVMGIYPEVQPK